MVCYVMPLLSVHRAKSGFTFKANPIGKVCLIGDYSLDHSLCAVMFSFLSPVVFCVKSIQKAVWLLSGRNTGTVFLEQPHENNLEVQIFQLSTLEAQCT